MTPPDDRQIDDRLRDVALPPGVADEIRLESLFDDAAIDRLLARLPLPDGLVDRVRTAALVAPPGARPQGPVDLERIATAGLAPVRAGGGSRVGGRLAGAVRDLLAVTIALGVVAGIVAGSGELSRQLVAVPATDAPELVNAVPDGRHEQGTRQPTVAAARPRVEDRTPGVEESRSGPPAALEPPAAARLPAADAGAERTSVAPTVRGAAVDTGGRSESSAALVQEFEVPGESLRQVPRLRGYDLAHEMTYGEQPFVDPAAAPALATDSPPLCLHTNSFDRRVFAAADTRWSSGLRAEHVLAALPAPPRLRSELPQPDKASAGRSRLRLDLRAIASLRTTPRRSVLVDVCVTAARPREAKRPPVNATLIMDRSVGADPLVWRWMCRSLGTVAAEMETEDRLSVLVGGSVPQLVLKSGDANAVASLATQLEQQPPQTATADLDAVVRVAHEEFDTAASPLVVVAQSVTLDRARDDVRAPLTAWQTALAACGGEPLDCHAAGGPRFIVIDTATPAEPPTRQPSFGRTPADPVAIRRAVVQHVFGRDTRAARQCRLDVSFDPRQVAAYRLVGHHQSAFESLSTASPTAIDLHRDETCRAVYEVFPRAGFGKGAVGATVRWRNLDDGSPGQATAVLAAGPDWQAAVPEASLCELLLAVTLGDAAGGSPHLDPRTIAAAKAVATRWRARGDVSAFGAAVIDCLERLRIDRRGSR